MQKNAPEIVSSYNETKYGVDKWQRNTLAEPVDQGGQYLVSKTHWI